MEERRIGRLINSDRGENASGYSFSEVDLSSLPSYQDLPRDQSRGILAPVEGDSHPDWLSTIPEHLFEGLHLLLDRV